jgi:hypothetical protein
MTSIFFTQVSYGYRIFFTQVLYDFIIFHSYYKKRKFNKFQYSKFYKALCRRVIVIIVVEKLTIDGKIEFIRNVSN